MLDPNQLRLSALRTARYLPALSASAGMGFQMLQGSVVCLKVDELLLLLLILNFLSGRTLGRIQIAFVTSVRSFGSPRLKVSSCS